MQFLQFIVITLLFCGWTIADDLIIRIKNGDIKGRKLVSYDGLEFRAFQAIPYAKSTAGSRRFKPPEPSDNWNGVFDATEFGEECPQFDFQTRGVYGSEDCLTINVYTPWKGNDSASLPVLVFIHGGGFVLGTGNYYMYPPEKLMDYPVVLVTFNYRLGILGFLNTQDDQAYGNYGMLDQVLALKWVQSNIEYFGGNKNKVTIFGESAGSSSVIHHLMSPLSNGLFHGAIAQSGALISNWTFNNRPLIGAYKVAEKVNCPIHNTKEMVDCFRSKSMHEIIYGDRLTRLTTFFPHYWSPSAEASNGPGFLREDPWDLLANHKVANKVPLVAGVLADEGFLFHKEFKSLFKEKSVNRVNELSKALAIVMKDPPQYEPVYAAIRKKYFEGPEVVTEEGFDKAVIDLLTDMNFKSGVAKTLEYLSEAGVPIFNYYISYITQYSLAQMFLLPAGKYASHGDEMFLQFPMIFTQFTRMNEDDTKMAYIINSLWTSFANTSKPSVTIDNKDVRWERFTKENQKYLELNLNPEMRSKTISEKVDFWTVTLPQLVKNFNSDKDEL